MFHKPQFPWHPEETKELRKLHAEGHTYAFIANELNKLFNNFRTRMAITGKAQRMGLPNRDNLQNKGYPVQSQALENFPTEKLNISIMELTNSSCRWPGEDKTYCGAKVKDRSSYCPTHDKRAYNQVAYRAKQE